MKLASAFVVLAVVAIPACSGTEPSSSPNAPNVGQVKSAETAASVEGTWAFVLDASDVAIAIRERCAAKSGGDARRTEACYAEVRTEAGNEKIRFAKDGAGHVWSSFGEEGGKRELWLEVPMALSSESPTRIVGKATGPAKGLHAAQAARKMPAGTLMRIEIVDGQTIAMQDPEKGRLVFRRDR